MEIGILHEGKNDITPLEVLVKRIILQSKPDFDINSIQFITYNAYGNIQGHIEPALRLFFRLNKSTMAILVADLDPGSTKSKSKLQRINLKTKETISKICPDATVINAFPKPELEEWLLSDESVVKSVLSISEVKLPYSELTPKDRLDRLITSYSKSYLTHAQIYAKIAQQSSLDILLTKRSYKNFHKKLQDAINILL